MKNSLFNDISQLRILFSRKDKIRFAVLFALMFSGSFLEAVGIGIIPGFVAFLMKPASLAKVTWLGSWTARLPDAPTLKLMVWAALVLIGFLAGKSIFLAGVYYAQQRIVNGFRVRLSCRMFNAYQGAPYEWLLQRSSSELQRNILNDVGQVVTGIIMPVLDLVMAFLMILFILAAMLFSTSTIALLGAAIIGGGVVFVIRVFRKQLEKTGQVMRAESKNIIQSIQQGFGALVDARLTGSEAYLSERFRHSITIQARMQTVRGSIMKSTPLVIELVAVAGLLMIFMIITKGSGSFVEAIPVMSVLGVASIRLKQVAGRVASQIQMLNTSRAYIPNLIRDICELDELARRAEVRSQRSEAGRQNTEKGISGFEHLVLENVIYAYPNTETSAVNGVTLELKKGESIAFVGATGCGKSTLVNLILGLFEPQSGSIKVNGADIFCNMAGWRRHLGYIPQTIFLLDDTIRANIAFGVVPTKVDDGRLKTALASARLDEFVSTLPQGLDTVVGERGVRLSGGQRQRIGIARALYFNPAVLVMDEATSALDNKTESEVMEAIQNLKKNRTLIMIAHRLSTVEDCSRLYYLQDGKQIAQGTFDELKEQSEAFRQMAMTGES